MTEPIKDIYLYGESLVFTGGRLVFEGNVIYDFNDRYGNISSVGMEQQAQVYYQLIKQIYESDLPRILQAQTMVIFAEIFKKMSSQNAPVALLSVGGNLLNSAYANVVALFGEDNLVYELYDKNDYRSNNSDNRVSIVGTSFQDLGMLNDKAFAAVLINIDLFRDDLEHAVYECNRLAAQKGQVILYGSGMYDVELNQLLPADDLQLYPFGTEGFIVSFVSKELSAVSYKANLKEQVLDLIHSYNQEVFQALQYVLSNYPIPQQEEWHTSMDCAIEAISRAEVLIAQYYILFDNMDLKYQTNEVKNAMLDFKYEAYLNGKHYDFFQATLYDCYNNWTENMV
ncbi:hypothetical protein [Cohnella cellulosilytica]|uniref:Uncharacterized protein n=1 Tax=Cohnella cellulosilytica TaxID=986710 RepID=A0ABW2FME9_9BACL